MTSIEKKLLKNLNNQLFSSELSEFFSDTWFSASETSSKEIFSSVVSSIFELSTSGVAVSESSAKSSLDTWIFSGDFLALLEGRIGVPLFEISP